MKRFQPVWRRWIGGVGISIGFVLFRLLLTPIRIRVLTEFLAPADYGMITLLSMSATGMAFVFSLGGFEVWLRRLPGADTGQRLALFRSVLLISSLIGGLAALGILLGWGPSVWYAAENVQLSSASVAALFIAFLHVHQRIYYLLGCNQHARARITQLLWGDLWFLLLVPVGYYGGWTAERALWVWSSWILVSVWWTWHWVPLGASMKRRGGRWVLSRELLAGLSMLPIILAEWIFRLAGQYVLLRTHGAEIMAFYALALNLALVGYAAGVPLVDVCMTSVNRKHAQLMAGNPFPPPELAALFTRALRWIMAINIPVTLALLFLSNPLLSVLASQAFRPAAAYLPWAAFLPGLMLLNLLLGRLALTQGRSSCAAWAAMMGALASVAASVFWAEARGAPGVFLAVTAGLLLTCLWLIFTLKVWRWMLRRELATARFVSGGGVLLCSYMLLAHIQGLAWAKMGAAAICALLVWKVFRWVDGRDFDVEAISGSTDLEEGRRTSV